MDFKQFRQRTFLTAAAAAAVYSVAAGKGPFNKLRFSEQHEALSRFVDNNYPDCSYSAITVHGKGWASVIRRRGRTVKFVYFLKGRDGNYIFTESDEKIN